MALAHCRRVKLDSCKSSLTPLSAGMVAAGLIFLLGRCVPSTCSKEDVEVGFNNFIRDLDAETAGAIGAVDWTALNCHSVHDSVDLDAADYGMNERFSNKTAIAPTASISIICGGASPGIEPIAANSYTHKTLSGSFNVRNKYLAKLLEKHGKNDDETWSSITTNQGSVSHLDFLTQEEKDVFKTAFELDQRWVIDLGADRTPYISQAQSINIFIPADIHKRDLHQIHFQAWKKGLKSLYYCRSKSIQRAENVNDTKATDVTSNVYKSKNNQNEQPEYEECLSCQ